MVTIETDIFCTTTRHGNIFYPQREMSKTKNRFFFFSFSLVVVCSTYGDLSQGKVTLGPSLILIHPSYLGPHALPSRNNVCGATVLQGMCCGRLWSYHIPLPRASGLLLWLRSSVCYPLGIPLHLGCSTVPIMGSQHSKYMNLIFTLSSLMKSIPTILLIGFGFHNQVLLT